MASLGYGFQLLEAITQTCQVSRFYDLSHALTSWQLISRDFSETQTQKKNLELLGSFQSLIDINVEKPQQKTGLFLLQIAASHMSVS